MVFHLENEIRLSNESEYKNLYSWSIQEFNSVGEKIGRDQVPWEWRLWFTASELRYYRTLDINQTYGTDDEEKNTNTVNESERITAILHPGRFDSDGTLEDDATFSMFGTNRLVKEFELYIYKINDGDTNESCSLWGSVSNTYELDFRDETMDDVVVIRISISQHRFNELTDIVKNKRADIVQVSISKVDGCYSDWSPSISTDSIKILTTGDDQKIVCPEGCDIKPLKLGQVGEFGLTIIQRSILNLKQDLRSINIYKLLGEEGKEADLVEEFAETEHDTNNALSAQHVRKEESDLAKEFAKIEPEANAVLFAKLARNEVAITKLRTPLWLIFILLLLFFLKEVF